MQLPYHRQAATSAMQVMYHLAVFAMCVLALVAVGAKRGITRLSKPRANSKALATAQDAPQRVMNVHIHLG